MPYTRSDGVDVIDFAYLSSIYQAKVRQAAYGVDSGYVHGSDYAPVSDSGEDTEKQLEQGYEASQDVLSWARESTEVIPQAIRYTLSVLHTMSLLLNPDFNPPLNKGSITNFNGFETRRNIDLWKELLTDVSDTNVTKDSFVFRPQATAVDDLDEFLATTREIIDRASGIPGDRQLRFKKLLEEPIRFMIFSGSLTQGNEGEEEEDYPLFWNELEENDKQLLNSGKTAVSEAMKRTRQMLNPTIIQDLMNRSMHEEKLDSLFNYLNKMTAQVLNVIRSASIVLRRDRHAVEERETAKSRLKSTGDWRWPTQRWRTDITKCIKQLEDCTKQMGVQTTSEDSATV
ncbi:hypothetical protein M231_00238 [Tremella mesenterica]|uniref:Uncharacterized protein n=1 Tax=Tremella mesenterica TaxID=5217 RepID=A0A4Q1BX37_TREME|nr:hypothetical protein M231_00238 [Tremella mesenterica]